MKLKLKAFYHVKLRRRVRVVQRHCLQQLIAHCVHQLHICSHFNFDYYSFFKQIDLKIYFFKKNFLLFGLIVTMVISSANVSVDQIDLIFVFYSLFSFLLSWHTLRLHQVTAKCNQNLTSVSKRDCDNIATSRVMTKS